MTWKTSFPSPEDTGWNPEKKAFLAGWHGFAKSPNTTLWLIGWKWNSRISLTFAVTLSGVKANPLAPTSILIVSALACEASARTAAVVKVVARILVVSAKWMAKLLDLNLKLSSRRVQKASSRGTVYILNTRLYLLTPNTWNSK